MSTKRRAGPDDMLPACMAIYLATGALPAARQGPHAREFEAYALKGKWLHGRHREGLRDQVLDELRALWEQHYDEIAAATPPGQHPWCLRVLEGDVDD